MLTDRSRRALAFASTLAIATALSAGSAHAQSFNAGSTVVSGSATVTTGTGTTTINVASPQAVINWTPNDTGISQGTPIDFQSAGTTATFQSTGQFAVLNRVVPVDTSRPIAFSGTVLSRIQGAASTPGGTVYFYSPGGILVNSSAVFDIGNLGLTSLDPVVDASGNWYNGNQVQFQQGANTSLVNVQAGAQITASQPNSYVALVAPAVQNNGGTINVNGAAALVAGEAATITFNPNGLFDIQVTVGTSAETSQGNSGNVALAQNGTITGPAGTAGTDNHRVYLVAVPKNSLMASVILGSGSSTGFTVASAADVSGNAVILSAGHNITAGAIESAPAAAAGSGTGRIDSFNAAYTSAVTSRSTGRTIYAADGQVGQGTTSFASNLTANAPGIVSLESRNGGLAQVTGNVTLSADAFGSPTVAATAGNAYLDANASQILIGGDAVVTAFASGGTATGGQTSASSTNGGVLNVGGILRVRSNSSAGSGLNATGGSALVTAQSGGAITVNQLNIFADAIGGDDIGSGAGNATGGNAQILALDANSTITVNTGNTTGNLNLLAAQAFGGSGGPLGGSAQGGTAGIRIAGGATVNLPVDPAAANFNRVFARAYGGDTLVTGGTGGTATGGTAYIDINGGTLNGGNLVLPSSFALGGSADPSVTGAANGGNAIGGFRNVSIVNGTFNGSFAGGGPGAQGGNGSALGTGGNGTGGTSNFFMDNGTITATTDSFGPANVIAFAQNAGGLGMIGGSATGGQVNVTIQNNSVITANPDQAGIGGTVGFGSFNSTPDATAAGTVSTGDAAAGNVFVNITNSQINAASMTVYADAQTGGMTTTGAGANARTGNATGGSAGLNLNNATISVGTLAVEAEAFSGDSNDSAAVNSGSATGGNANLNTNGGSSTITASGGVTIDSLATAGTIFSGGGNGGTATGGFAGFNANVGSISIVGDLSARAMANGGDSRGSGAGGAAFGGTVSIFTDPAGGSLSISGDADADSSLYGGDSTSGAGGNATAGNGGARFISRTGSITIGGNANAYASAFGGDGLTAGGNAISGDAALVGGAQVNGGQPGLGGTVAAASADIDSSAFGGNGIVAGTAQGGSSRIVGNAGTVNVSGAASLYSSGFGGDGLAGGAGGTGTAGVSLVNALNNTAGPSSVSLGTLLLDSSGFGGNGGTGVSGGSGGAGGAGFGGSVQALGGAGSGTVTVGNVTAYGSGYGGFGGDGGSSASGIGGAGGSGGIGVGGVLNIGTASFADTSPANTGSGTYGAVDAETSGFGGLGGDGGTGTTQGNGGAGGSAFNGAAIVLVRGSPVTFNGAVNLTADAVGGNGGLGATQGAGGNATVGTDPVVQNPGGLGVTVTGRFQHPEQRGTLTAGTITGTATATAGQGSTAGTTYLADGPIGVEITNASASASSINLSASAATVIDTSPSFFTMTNATADIGNLSIVTPGSLAVTLDSSTANVGSLTFNAGNFVLAPTRPATLGTFNISSGLQLLTGRDLLIYANFVTPFGVSFSTSGAILFGNFTANGNFSAASGTTLGIGDVSASSIFLQGPAGLTAGALSSGGAVILRSNAPVTTGAINAASLDAQSATSITTQAITTTGATFLGSLGPISAGAINAGTSVKVRSNTDITVGDVNAGSTVDVNGNGMVTVGNVTAGSGGQFTVGIGSLGGPVTIGNISARGLVAVGTGTSLTTGNIAGTDLLGFVGTGTATFGAISTGTLNAAGQFTPGGRVLIENGTQFSLGGTIDNFNAAAIFGGTRAAAAGAIAINGSVATGMFEALSNATVTTGTIGATSVGITGNAGITVLSTTASQTMSLVSNAGAIRTDNLQAGDSIFLAGSGGVTINGTATAGTVNPSTNPGARFKVAIGGGTGNVTGGAISAAGDLGIQTGGSIATGNLVGRDVLLLPGTSLTTGSIFAGTGTQPSGRVYVGNFSMANQQSNVFLNFNSQTGPLPIFALDPVRTGGPIAFNGSITAATLYAATAQGISLQAVTANLSSGGFFGDIQIDAGGTATVNGRLAAGNRIDIASGDIVIGDGGSLDALSSDGEILLASNNAAGMFVGDGLTAGNGYALSNAEFAKLKAGQILIVGDDLSNATDMTIGNLSIAGSQLYGATDAVVFATGNRATQTPSGLLRINGAVNATGFGATQEVDLLAGTVELETTNGSLKIGGTTPGSLSGLISISADRIHVADDTILTKLRADPLYAGRIADLNAPAKTQRTDGVLNALGLEIEVGSTLYVQNTGTAIVPAGFLTSFDNSDVTVRARTTDQGTTTAPTASIVINGQFQTETGRVTGMQAFQLVQADPTPDSEQFAGFSADSQFNGCVFLTGVCSLGASSAATVSSNVSSTITAVTHATVDDSPTAPTADNADEGDDGSSDEQKDEDSDKDTGSSPITPPVPLINTSAISGAVNVVEPVSGAGNPALFGSAVNEGTAQGDNQ